MFKNYFILKTIFLSLGCVLLSAMQKQRTLTLNSPHIPTNVIFKNIHEIENCLKQSKMLQRSEGKSFIYVTVMLGNTDQHIKDCKYDNIREKWSILTKDLYSFTITSLDLNEPVLIYGIPNENVVNIEKSSTHIIKTLKFLGN